MGSCVQRELVVGEAAYVGASGNRDSQLVSRSVLRDYFDDVLIISAGG